MTPELRTAVCICLVSNFPININWGPGRVQIYSNAERRLNVLRDLADPTAEAKSVRRRAS